MSTTTPIRQMRLSELAATVSATVNKAFARQTYWVVADVTSHTCKADTNYHYFDLVEKDAVSHALVARLAAKAWGGGAQSIARFQQLTGQRFTNNIEVLVNVSVQYHPVYGLQLNLNEVDPSFTLGRLEQQRLATLQRLVQENPAFIRREGDGFHTYNKGLPLPRVVQRIAIVSSKTSAGWQDFTHTLENNPFGYRYTIRNYFTIVQGEANAEQFVDRLVDVFRSGETYDVVVIIRGGGAQTDLLLFDEYLVGKAIAKFPIPVITGIGHQRNETIADLMANLATKTPTKAAEFIIAHCRRFEDAINALQQRIVIRSQQRLATDVRRLEQFNNGLVNASRHILTRRNQQLMALSSVLTSRPAMLLSHHRKDLQQAATDLQRSTTLFLRTQHSQLEHYRTMIRLLSPENTLKRGFAIVKVDNRITSNPDDLQPQKEIEILLREQQITAKVLSKEEYHGNDFNI